MSDREELERLRKRKRLAELESRVEKKTVRPETIPETLTPFEKFGKGMADVWQGGRQLLPEGYGGYTPEQAADVADSNRIYNEGYNYWDSSKDEDGNLKPDIDGFRMAGQAIATAPLMAIPGGQTTAMARLGTGALSGGIAGGLLYEENPSDKKTNAGLGATAGGIFSVAAPAVAKLAGKGFAVGREGLRRMGNFFNEFDPKITGTITKNLDDALKSSGTSLDEIGGAVREKLIKEANQSIKNTGAFDADALVRKYRAESMGFVDDAAITTGQATRDPKVWGKEVNIAKGEDEAGGILATRFNNQKNRITTYFKDLQGELFGEGAEELTPYTVVNNLSKSIKDKADALQVPVREAYAKVPGGVSLSKDSLSNRTQQVLRDWEGVVPQGVINKIDDIVNNPNRAFTFDDYEVLDKLMTKTMKGSDQLFAAKNDLSKAIAGVFDDTGSGLKGEAKVAYDYAKSLAKKRFDAIGKDKNLVGMLKNGGVDDQRFLNKLKTGSSVDEIKNLFEFADEGSQKQIRALLLNDLIEQSTPSGNFSQKSYNNYIKKMAKEKLDIVFGGKADELRTLGKIVEDMYSAPSGHTANFSNSGIEIGNMVRRVYSGLIEGISPEARIVSAFLPKSSGQAAQNQAVVDLALTSGLPVRPSIFSSKNPIQDSTLSTIGGFAPSAGIFSTK